MKRLNIAIGVILAVLLYIFPIISPSTFLTYLLTQIFIFGLFAIGYDLLLGYTGMLSFGQAGLFGIGAYTCTILLKNYSCSLSLALLIAIIITCGVSIIIGFISIQTSGIYFAMLTLVFGQLIYEISLKAVKLTGGADGIVGVPRSTFLFIDMSSDANFYYLTLSLLVGFFLLSRILILSPFGQVLRAIGANEERTRLLGYGTKNFKLIVFCISGVLAGLAGGLFAPFLGCSAPALSHWSISGDVVMMTLIGGKGTLIGPILGAAFIHILKDVIGSYTEYWMIILGLIFVLFVLLVPEGIVGLLKSIVSRKESR